MSGSLWARLKRLEEKRGLSEEPEMVCPVCGLFPGRIIFGDEPMCPKCLELREALPPSALPPVQIIEFRDNTRPREEIERARAIREEFHVDD
jgi:hypothetical protein